MEFDFQKKKQAQFILDHPATPRNRNSNEMRGMSAFPDFHHSANPQVMIPNYQTESNHFPRLGNITPTQIPQFLFDQGSPTSSDENFLLSHNAPNKMDETGRGGQMKSLQSMDPFFNPSPESPQNASSPCNDFQIATQFHQQPYPFQNNMVSMNKENNSKQYFPEKPVIASEMPVQSNEHKVDKDAVSRGQKPVAPPPKTLVNSFEMNEVSCNFNEVFEECRESCSQLESDKSELNIKLANMEVSLKEYQDEALNYKKKYEEVQEKLKEEVNNRDTVLAQVEQVNGVSQLIQQHCSGIDNTLKLYSNINNEQGLRYSKLEAHAEEMEKRFGRILSEKKTIIENFKSQNLELTNKLEETLRVRNEISKQIEETNNKLCEEQKKYTTLEKMLVASEKENRELLQKHEQSENTFSEKYSELELKFEDTKSKLENLKTDNAELKIYREKCSELEYFVGNLQKEKEALLEALDSSQQNLSKSEDERKEQQRCLEHFDLEREAMNEVMSKLKEECSDLNSKLKAISDSYELLFSENNELKEKYQVASEELEGCKVEKFRLEEEIKKASDNAKITDNINLEMKSLVVDLQKELSDVKSEVKCKTENVVSLEEKLSSFESKNEELQQTVNNLTETLAAKELQIKDLTALISTFEINLGNKNEEIKQIQEDLDQSKVQMMNARQEMSSNIDQYREQFMNQLKEAEKIRNELQSKYENVCAKLEKSVESKKPRRLPSLNKRVDFEDDFSDSSSIDLQAFFNRRKPNDLVNERESQSFNSAQKENKQVDRVASVNQSRRITGKFFKRSTKGNENADIFG